MTLPILVPPKPAEGAPCNGCGLCCAMEVCRVGLAVFGDDAKAPCPGLTFHHSRFWCGVVERAPASVASFLRSIMGIGVGCDSDGPAEAGGKVPSAARVAPAAEQGGAA